MSSSARRRRPPARRRGAVRAFPISLRAERFVHEYVVDLNATQAAIRAGYSKKTARQQGQRLLINVDIQKRIARTQEAVARRAGVSPERVLEELRRVAFSDVRTLMGPGGVLLRPDQMAIEASAPIASIKLVMKHDAFGEIERVQEVRMWDKVKALELLGKHLALFTERVEHRFPRIDPTVIERLSDDDLERVTALAREMGAVLGLESAA